MSNVNATKASVPAPSAGPTSEAGASHAPARRPLQRRHTLPLSAAETKALDRSALPALPRPTPSTPNLAALQSPTGQVAPPLPPKSSVHVDGASSVGEAESVAGTSATSHAHAAASADATHDAPPTKEAAQARLETAYRLNLEKLHQQTRWTRKAMPMVMQSAGMGLALAGALHNPLLLFLAPVLLVSGAIMAAPAGWALSKVLQWRVANKNPLVKLTLQNLDDNLAQQPGAAEAKARVLAENPKLKYAEELARGQGKLFENGFKAAFVGPFKFWRKQFNETLTMMGSVVDARKNRPHATGDEKSVD